MQTTPISSKANRPPSTSTEGQAPDIASASVSDALAALHVDAQVGLTTAEVGVRRKAHGYNEVTEAKPRPILAFLKKFWGISAWMLELILILSAVLGIGGFPQLDPVASAAKRVVASRV